MGADINDEIRLNKFIASSGYCSRRKADELILSGRVSVNYKTVESLGTKVNPVKDVVKIDGEKLKASPSATKNYIYILLNKPSGYITTTSDEKNRPAVVDLVKVKERIYPVGRLDYETEGLLILTNDGDLANKLMHPSHEVKKTYLVKLNKPIEERALNKLASGVNVDGKKTAKANVTVVEKSEQKQITITIHEGRNRQVRKMLEAIGYFTRKLKRIEYAGLNIGNLKTGEWRYLNAKEVEKLKSL